MKNTMNQAQNSTGNDIELNKPIESKTYSFNNKEMQNITKTNMSKTSDNNLFNLYNAKSQFNLLHFTLYIILIFLQTILTYVIKPVCTILQLVLLSQIATIRVNELEEQTAGTITNAIKAVGYCIIFAIPLINFFLKGIMIISIQYTVIGKIYITFILLIEFIFQLPLTFMFDNNLHSIFLFDQRGIEQLLCPWLVFFPSDYLLSIFELVRQYIDAIFFLVIGFETYSAIKGNRYQAFSVSIVLLINVLCIFRIIGNTLMLVIRIVWGNSEEKGLKKAKRKNK